MRIATATDLKTRTGVPDKDARLKNSYIETRGDQSVVRKRPIAQGGVSVGTGIAQGGINFNGLFLMNGDVLSPYTGGGTNWNSGTTYGVGNSVSVGFVNYWANTSNTNSQPPNANWSTTFVPPIPAIPYIPTTWTARTLSAASNWYDVCWNGTFYCAVSYSSGTSAISTNGVSWITGTMPVGFYPASVVWNGTFFLATGTGIGIYNAATSTDGINWTGQTIPYGNGGDFKVAWNGTIFCAVETNIGSPPAVATSSNGVTWTAGAIANSAWTAIIYGGGKFVVVGANTTPAYSTDGLIWNLGSGATSSLDVAYGGGVFVATPRNSASGRISANGVNWSSITLPVSGFWGGISWNGSCFMAIDGNAGNASAISAVSTNGTSWTQLAMPSSQQWMATANNGHDFISIAYGSTAGATTP